MIKEFRIIISISVNAGVVNIIKYGFNHKQIILKI